MTEPTTAPSAPVVVAVALAGDQVGGGWGRAQQVALATVQGAAVTDWQVQDVRWDVSHDEGGEGSHHARIVRFLREHGVEVVVTGHMGPPMANTLAKLGVRTVLGVTGDARAAAVAAAAV